MTVVEMEKEADSQQRASNETRNPDERKHYELLSALWAIGAEIVRRLETPNMTTPR